MASTDPGFAPERVPGRINEVNQAPQLSLIQRSIDLTQIPASRLAMLRLQRRCLGRPLSRLRLWMEIWSNKARIVWVKFTRRAVRWVGTFLATLAAVAIAALFALSVPSPFPSNLSVNEVHLACAGIIGTALALVLTLSIVPAQRAADVFSSAILRLYAQDRPLLLVFGLLSTFALISVLMGTGWSFGLGALPSLALQLVLLGASLDALRLFYTRTLDLLVPSTALGLVEKSCGRHIGIMAREASRFARLVELSDRRAAKGGAVGLRWAFYQAAGGSAYLTGWIQQLEEFAHKAVARRDTQAAVAAASTIGNIALRYVGSRRESFLLQPDFSGPLPGAASDVGQVLNPAYESLKNVCEDAVRQPNEAIAIGCIETFGRLAAHVLTMIHVDHGGWKTAPLTHAPVFYLDLCAKKVGVAGMDDALLTTIRQIGLFLGEMKEDVRAREAETTALDCLYSIALTSEARQAIVPCFAAVEMMLRAAAQELTVRGLDGVSILNTVLTNLATLVPFEVAMEKAGKRLLQTFPPYNIAFPASIPELLRLVAGQVKPVDPTQSWIDPFEDFAEASEKVVHHYRGVAENTSFDGVLLEKWIIETIIRSAYVHLGLLRSPPEGGDAYLDTVENRLIWFIHVPTFFFKEKVRFPFHHANEAGGYLAKLGIELLDLARFESARACGEAVASIGRTSSEADDKSAHRTADIMVNLEILGRAAEALAHAAAAAEFRSMIGISDTALPGFADALRQRIARLDEDVASWRRDDRLVPYSPVPGLKRILRRKRGEGSSDDKG